MICTPMGKPRVGAIDRHGRRRQPGQRGEARPHHLVLVGMVLAIDLEAPRRSRRCDRAGTPASASRGRRRHPTRGRARASAARCPRARSAAIQSRWLSTIARSARSLQARVVGRKRGGQLLDAPIALDRACPPPGTSRAAAHRRAPRSPGRAAAGSRAPPCAPVLASRSAKRSTALRTRARSAPADGVENEDAEAP